MDLPRLAGDVVQGILKLFSDTSDSGEPWAANETAFEAHFGTSYAYFGEVLRHLDDEQAVRFAETMEVNPEAAVLWVLAMEPVRDDVPY